MRLSSPGHPFYEELERETLREEEFDSFVESSVLRVRTRSADIPPGGIFECC